MYSIYVHTFPDGKKYVGSTSLDVEKRWQSGRGYKDQKEMSKAIKFFGWDNIQHQVLETVEDKETALKREEYYTLLFRSNEPEFGYNILAGRKGVGHPAWNKGLPCSTETKQKISEMLKEYHKNNEFSEYTKKKISETNMRPVRLKNKNTGEIFMFDSQQSCAKFFSVSMAHISHFINGKRQCKSLKDYEVLK